MEAINWHIYVQRQPRPALPLSSLKDSKYNNDLDIDSYESLTAFSFINFPPLSFSSVREKNAKLLYDSIHAFV